MFYNIKNMVKEGAFDKFNKRPKSGLTESVIGDVSYMSEMAEEETKSHVDSLQRGEANILVAVRSRPLTKAEEK